MNRPATFITVRQWISRESGHETVTIIVLPVSIPVLCIQLAADMRKIPITGFLVILTADVLFTTVVVRPATRIVRPGSTRRQENQHDCQHVDFQMVCFHCFLPPFSQGFVPLDVDRAETVYNLLEPTALG